MNCHQLLNSFFFCFCFLRSCLVALCGRFAWQVAEPSVAFPPGFTPGGVMLSAWGVGAPPCDVFFFFWGGGGGFHVFFFLGGEGVFMFFFFFLGVFMFFFSFQVFGRGLVCLVV